MKNQWGFSMLNFCFLIPIIFASGVLVFGSFQIISKYTDAQRECRIHVMGAQQILGQKLKELLDLNPLAKSLRTQEKTLKIARAAAILPSVIAAIQAKIIINQFQQSILRGKQELILATAKIQAQREMAKLPTQINGVKFSNPHLKVYKSPPNAIAPDHHTMPFFTEVQTLKAHWKVPIQNFVPKIILKVFKNYPSAIEGKCAATLIRKGDVWNPKLHQARF